MPRLIVFALLVGLAVLLAACSYPDRLPPVPRADTTRALPLGIANARFFADGAPGPMIAEVDRATERERAALVAAAQPARSLPPAFYLAISGGGDEGAFGAGVLGGWTVAGDRPIFKMVTGISTGAMMAPMAFLGPQYDAALREAYTVTRPSMIFRKRPMLSAALFDDALADTSPLAEMIAKVADQKMFDAIAREYEKGRLLLIGTTDLDARRPVIWNVGALSVSRHPQALDLFHKILRASAAIPGAFQPVMIDVELDGRKYQEMHVDGGAIAQLFLYPPTIDLVETGARRERRAYVIRNARLDPSYSETKRQTLAIAGHAISTMLVASGYNDILRTYFVARHDGVDYNFAYIGEDFTKTEDADFDQAYMQGLYDYAYRRAATKTVWHKLPPGLVRTETGR